MFNKRNVIIGLVILVIVGGLIGNHFFPTEDKPAPSVAEKVLIAKKVEKPPPPTVTLKALTLTLLRIYTR